MEDSSLVVVELESTAEAGWNSSEASIGVHEIDYLYGTTDYFSNPGSSLLSYQIKINHPEIDSLFLVTYDSLLLDSIHVESITQDNSCNLIVKPQKNASGEGIIELKASHADGEPFRLVYEFNLIKYINAAPTIDQVEDPELLLDEGATHSVTLTGLFDGNNGTQELSVSIIRMSSSVITTPQITYTQGENAIRIYNSSHITFSGFRLHQNTILACDQDGTPLSPDPGGGVVKHAGVEIIDSDHITFERNHIDISEDINFEQNWIIVDEKENELDGIDHSTEDVRIAYNYFSEKTTSRGNFITVKGIDGEPLGKKNDDTYEPNRTIAQRTYIGYNHFDGFSIVDGSGNNEAIRLGRGAVQEQFAYTVFEHNLLERWDPNGDTEIITVKSSSNILRYNTFKDSRGRITNRSGDFNIYEGNFFTNIECPIRLIGNNHIVIGNYAEKSEANFMVLSSGKNDDSGGYDVAENCIIAFNTVIDRGSINRADREGTDPRNNVISHNIFYDAGSVLGPDINATTGTGNILFNTAPGKLPAHSYQTLDPKLVRDANNIYRLDLASPVPGGLSPSESAFYQSMGSQPGYEHYTAVTGLAGYTVGGEQIGSYYRLTAKDVGPYANSNFF